MPTLPRADFFVARQTGPSQVLANPDMFSAEARGIQDLGQSIQQAGNVAAQYAIRMDHANYVAKSAEADRKVKTAWTSYQEEMLTNKAKPDEWVKGWNKTYSEVSKDVDLTGLSKAAQERVKQQMLTFRADSSAEISSQATKQRIRNGQAEITTSAGLDLKNGDLPGYELKIKEGAKAGFFDPAMEQKLLEQGRIDFDVEQANKAINENPIAATDALEEKTEGGKWRNFKNVSENQRLSLLTEAKRKTSTLRSETSQSIYERRANGELIEPQELDGLVSQGLLTANQAKGIEREQRRSGDDPSLIPEYASVIRETQSYDPNQDPSRQGYAKLVQQQAKFPPHMRDELNRILTSNSKFNGEKHSGDKSVTDWMKDMYDGGMLGEIGKYPMTDTKRPGKYRDPQGFQRANEKFVELTSQLQRFMSENPKATPTQQREFIQSKIAVDEATRAATGIINGLSGMSQKQAAPRTGQKVGKYTINKVGE